MTDDEPREGATPMSELTFRSDIRVEAVPELCCGSDQQIAHAAWVLPPWVDGAHSGRDDTPDGWRRVIRGTTRGRHRSPFEQGNLTAYVEAPGVVWWQLTRYRFMSMETDDLSRTSRAAGTRC
jgi:thymidylate synthase ThyX